MEISLNNNKRRLKLLSGVFFILFAMLIPFSAFSQDEPQQPTEEEQVAPSNIPQATAPVIGGDPWENSAGSTIGTQDLDANSGTRGSTPGTLDNPASRPAQRPGEALGIDPPGNPDVPFDTNMNLLFLASGLVFAFWVVKKKIIKSSVIKN
jgi:hypothetical protein